MLLISLGLHGLLLVMPIPAEKKAEVPKKEEKVKISQLPSPATSPTLKGEPPKLPPKPTPVASPPIPRSGAPVIRQPQVQSSARQPIQQPKPNQTPAPPAQQTPSPQASPSPSPQPSQQSADPFTNFPSYPNAQPGSGGVLKQDYDQPGAYVFNTQDELSAIVSFFEKQLPLKGFNSPVLNSDPKQTEFRVYQVSPKAGGSSQYLYLVSQNEKRVILRSSELYDLNQLKNADAEVRTQEDADFDDALQKVDDDISLEAITVPKFDDPNTFSSIGNKFNPRYQTSSQRPISRETLYSNISEKLTKGGFILKKTNSNYGGGDVYRVTKNNFVIYLSLAPADSGKRTVISTSKSSP